MESTPANTVIHYWHYDPEFSESPGNPKPLVFDGVSSFSSLVRRYAGDIPPGALRTELKRAGTIMENSEGVLVASGRYFQPRSFHEDFIRNIAFSVQNLATTVAHNAEILIADRQELGRFERFAWTERLDPVALDELRLWVRREGAQFLERADDWIGQNELPREMWSAEQAHAVGVGVYYFEEDP